MEDQCQEDPVPWPGNGNESGGVVINIDDAFGERLAADKASAPHLRFAGTRLRATEIQLSSGSTGMTVETPQGRLAAVCL
ncbi:MAG: hypothetical protein U1G07_03320 [Verrucomicrobiota bacterium]